LGKIATGLATAVYKDNNQRIIDALNRGSEVLDRLQDSFSSILGQLDICSFFEEYAYGITGSKVRTESILQLTSFTNVV
jgi:hypothetical protein